MKFIVELEKRLIREVPPAKLKAQVEKIAEIPASRFTVRKSAVIRENMTWRCTLSLTKERFRSPDAVGRAFTSCFERMQKRGENTGWTVSSTVPLPSASPVAKPAAGKPGLTDGARRVEITDLPPLTPEVMTKYFSRFYGRDTLIRNVYRQMRQAVLTNFKMCGHVLMYGEPGCAKSEIYLAMIDWLGTDLFWRLDGGTLTKAGLERQFISKAQSGTLPQFVLVEEMEKGHEESFRCLVQVMDSRQKIQRTNATQGDISADTPVLILATCNNLGKLGKFADGAILSRLANKWQVPRPNREEMHKIVVRDIRSIEGDVAWAEPITKFLWEVVKPHHPSLYNDPRFARALIAGREELLGGTFLADYALSMGIVPDREHQPDDRFQFTKFVSG